MNNSSYSPRKILDGMLDVLSVENLHVYNVEELARSLVGLKIALKQDLPIIYSPVVHVSLPLLKRIVEICLATRARLDELGVAKEGLERKHFAQIVAHLDSVFSASYRVTQQEIDDAKFDDKLRELLIELDLRNSDYPNVGRRWGGLSSEEIRQQDAEKLQSLLGFARVNVARVITSVYRWAETGYGKTARIDSHAEQVIEVFELLKDARREVHGVGKCD